MILQQTHDVNHCSGELGTMHRAKRIPITELNQHLICVLCKGYFIDATTIIECLHSFCRSCIVQYLEKNKYCPVCDVQVHKTKPLLNIRPDKTLQSIVYKLVPGLFQNEMQKRKGFYAAHPESKASLWEQLEEASYQYLLTPEETICLSLKYHDSENTPRYLQCQAAVSVAHLQKLIRAKYDLTDQHKVDLLYNQDCLNSDLTIVDIACIYLWRKKGPLELTYRIYENAKRQKLDVKQENENGIEQTVMNNNDWKEVQLRISENGEMSITGIQDSIEDIMSEHGITQKTPTAGSGGEESANQPEKEEKPVVVKEETTTTTKTANKKAAKRELPALKVIEKGAGKNQSIAIAAAAKQQEETQTNKNESSKPIKEVISDKNDNKQISDEVKKENFEENKNKEKKRLNLEKSVERLSSDVTIEPIPAGLNENSSTKSTITPVTSTNTQTHTTHSLNNTTATSTNSLHVNKSEVTITVQQKPDVTATTMSMEVDETHHHLHQTSGEKHKLQNDGSSKPEGEPPIKQSKPTILNHSLGLQTYNKSSLKRPLSQKEQDLTPDLKNRVNNNVSAMYSTVYSNKPPIIINKHYNSYPNTGGSGNLSEEQKAVQSKAKPFYNSPKPATYSPIINVPKVQPSTSTSQNQKQQQQHQQQQNVEQQQQTSAVNLQQQQQNIAQNKMTIKSKPSTPIGYKTLRNPPKSWNPQISRSNLPKPSADPKYTDMKNVRPAKFFKMRNNMPRYLGNPASGVKPMYQVHVSPDKDKVVENVGLPPKEKHQHHQTVQQEIKKHSIVKIDPKTLKPISERAPDTSNLSNQSDLKINTSSVSIFNPLKLQQSSPKNDRKSPKSPHSPKPKSSSPPTKREKLNLNFTPSNPFIPNLGSPTVNPNQFLYPPGFPSYDPRVMAAYHSAFLYSQRLPFPLSLDMNQRKGLELMSQQQTSPKLQQTQTQNHNSTTTITTNPKTLLPSVVNKSQATNSGGNLSSPIPNSQCSIQNNVSSLSSTSSSTTSSSQQQQQKLNQASASVKKAKDLSKPEKSLLNTVEKLSQNRAKESLKNSIHSSINEKTDLNKPAVNSLNANAVVDSNVNKHSSSSPPAVTAAAASVETSGKSDDTKASNSSNESKGDVECCKNKIEESVADKTKKNVEHSNELRSEVSKDVLINQEKPNESDVKKKQSVELNKEELKQEKEASVQEDNNKPVVVLATATTVDSEEKKKSENKDENSSESKSKKSESKDEDSKSDDSVESSVEKTNK